MSTSYKINMFSSGIYKFHLLLQFTRAFLETVFRGDLSDKFNTTT